MTNELLPLTIGSISSVQKVSDAFRAFRKALFGLPLSLHFLRAYAFTFAASFFSQKKVRFAMRARSTHKSLAVREASNSILRFVSTRHSATPTCCLLCACSFCAKLASRLKKIIG